MIVQRKRNSSSLERSVMFSRNPGLQSICLDVHIVLPSLSNMILGVAIKSLASLYVNSVTVIANLFTWVICQCSFVELYFVKVVNIIITIHMVRCVLCFIKSWRRFWSQHFVPLRVWYSPAISALKSSDRVRRPIRLRPPSNRAAFGVQSDCVRCTMKECWAEDIRSATSTVSFLSTWAAQWCPLRGTGSRRWLSRALLRGWLPRHRADSRRNKGGTSVRLRRCRRAWG